jgi:hypothetical protein
MPNDATPIPHPPSATETDTRAALAWVIAQGLLQGDELAAASEPLEWNPHAQWLASPNWEKGVFMIHLVRRAAPKLRFDMFREHPHRVETRITFDLPAHVFAAGD